MFHCLTITVGDCTTKKLQFFAVKKINFKRIFFLTMVSKYYELSKGALINATNKI